MSYSRDEIEALEKRLEAVESTINVLKEEDLLIAQMLGSFLCTIEYNICIKFLKGEGLESYARVWSKKLEDTRKEIELSQTVESAFDIFLKFDRELWEYVKAEKVTTATEAMDIAHSFVKKYSGFALPLRAAREDDVWLVDIDVGALAVKVAKIKVDARTGDILSYEIPEK